MPEYRKLLKFLVQPILGVWDEDGELTAEEPLAPQPVFYRYGASLEELAAQIERDYRPAPQESRR